jgi:hypothetical protein
LQVDAVWSWLGIGQLRPLYADLVAILAAGQARIAGLDVYAIPNPFDPFGRPHVYGPWWLVTGWLGLKTTDAWWIGSLLGLLFLLGSVAVLAPRDRAAALWSIGWLCSPPVMLGLERGNNDLVVFLLLAAAAGLVARASVWGPTAGAALVGFAAGLKIYPIVAVPMLAMRWERWRSLMLLGGAGVVVWLVFGGEWTAGMRRAMAAAPAPETVFAHGISIAPYTWTVLSPTRGVLITVGLLAVAGAAWLLARDWRALWHAVPLEGLSAACFIAGAMPWVFCFWVTSNFPYRLVLLVLPMRLWLAQRTDAEHSRSAGLQLTLWTLVAWLAVPKHWAIEWLRDESASSLLGITLITALEQGVTLVLTLAMSWSVTGWLVRQARRQVLFKGIEERIRRIS